MVVRKRKKSRKLRGSRTHAWGSVGQHRKSGSKGGVGAVGFMKHKWTWTVKYYPDWYGKHGFTRAPAIQVKINGINVSELNEVVHELAARGEIEKQGDLYEIDLGVLGINKLLGRGKIDLPVKVRVAYATERAIKKVEEAGGEVILTSKEEETQN